MKMWLFMLTIFNVISKVRVAFISGQGHTNANLARDKPSSKSWHCACIESNLPLTLVFRVMMA